MEEMNPDGYWKGELSSSALAVAVSIAALHFHDSREHKPEIQRGLNWLQQHVNTDGSFGDTVDSPGNVSTSLLVYAAVNLYAATDETTNLLRKKVRGWLVKKGIDVESDEVSRFILNHYQKDYTFSVPILTLCGLCGVPGPEAFRSVPQLPFELALLPRGFYRFLKLSVVSYAIPALVAVGIVVYKKKRSNFLWRLIRHFSIKPALKRLQAMMPESGGFLEAIPLTAFVSLSLVEAGYRNLSVVDEGIAFLKRTQRADGGWPIDVDLSTWVTTLAVKSMRSNLHAKLGEEQKDKLISHLLKCQNKVIHPFNGSRPGGWGWTSYPGSVPDGDDTPGVILALLKLGDKPEVLKAIMKGCLWLKDLQNSDGGFPTFSRGWGKLPFDQSTSDLTGHCVLALTTALSACAGGFTAAESTAIRRMIRDAISFLESKQRDDGSWIPLWFGNQQMSDHSNPVYGTARVVTYLQDTISLEMLEAGELEIIRKMVGKGQTFLQQNQNEDGSWGAALGVSGSIEETALAISALAENHSHREICDHGLTWLFNKEKEGMKAAPIGLYFASLWYFEKLYPLTFYLEAVNKLLELEPFDD
ncbi:prenyltransferase/squalene oxidase repeat-containing protein [Mangrovibacterium diazotrophicum]|nr:prenyltransferase/squalene oxidase repeat-containing protein [Mangrovibacterium diazotrophicum]